MLDDGYGMDLVIKVRVFDFFFMMKDVGEGMGFGFFVVYGIVE